MTKTVTLSSGIALIIRKPTEKEALTFADKRQDAQDPDTAPQDALDDGDEELLACVTSPIRDVVEDLLEDYPLAVRHIADAVRELGGDMLDLTEDQTLADGMRATHGKRLLGIRIKEPHHALVLTKVGRVEMKFLLRDMKKAGRKKPSFAQLAQLAKEHCINAPDSIWEEIPFLSANLGMLLFLAAMVKVEAEAGKS